ncbi:MAG: PAS domain S-box protein [Thermoanaerobaculia bacterium]|jgi:PAS domain S-box-containing protein
MTDDSSGPALESELEELRARLHEAQEELLEVRSGHADVAILESEDGAHAYTLGPSTDRIYRQLIETMNEGAVTLSPDGVILYCNARVAEMLGRPLDQVIGSTLRSHLPPADVSLLDNILAQARVAPSRRELSLKLGDGRLLPVYLSASGFESEDARTGYCLVLMDLTEQKTHEQIVSAERLARSVLEQAAEAIVVCDGQGRIIRASNPTLQICEGTPLLRFFDEVFALRTESSGPFQLAEVLRGETVRNLDVSLLWQARRLDLILNAGPLVSGQKILGCVVTLTDITDRKQVEAALLESRQVLEGVINAIPARIFWKDLNLVYRGCNTAFAQDSGLADRNDVVGKDDFQMGWHDQAEAYRADDRQVIESGVPKLLIEEPQTTPEGGTITLLTSKVPLRNSAGQVEGVIGMYMDISERKRTKESQARLATAVEQSADTIVITDIDGRIVYANPAFEKVTGFTREEALGRNPRILKSGKQDAEFYRQMWAVLGNGDVWSGHLINKRKDGTLFEEEASISPVRDTEGRVVNYVAVKRDVTEELRLTERLAQAQKMEVVGRLAAGVAHDFNNLLGVISGYGELVHRQLRDEDPLRDKMEQILRATERAGGLTRQLLAFGRKQVLRPRVLDLSVVVSEMEKMLHRLIREDVELSTRLVGESGRVMADPGQVEQVLMNLVVNARDAMPNGGRITIETRSVELDAAYADAHLPARPGRYVVLSVGDTGSGMDAETQAHVFEPFFTTKAQGKGTGLGLATVFGIIEQSGGFVLLSSEVGVGTTFSAYLPRIDDDVPAAPDEKQRSLLRGDEIVLLVEDEVLLREMLCEALEANGYVTLVAGNGPEAVQMAKERAGSIDLLLTDMVMPGMTGTELADLITRTRPEIKVLFMSGYSEEAAAQGGLIAPGRAFIGKPFGLEPLLFKLRELMNVS